MLTYSVNMEHMKNAFVYAVLFWAKKVLEITLCQIVLTFCGHFLIKPFFGPLGLSDKL